MFKREYGARFAKEIPLIKKEEKKLAQMIEVKINVFYNKINNSKDKVKNNLNILNPLTSHLYFKISINYIHLFLSIFK